MSGTGRTVLVVSNDTRLALSIERLIERRELGDVFIAGSGEQATDLIRAIVFTTVIVDVNLPSKRGIALLLALKRARPKIHRVALGHGSHRAMFRLVEREVAHVALPTPVDVHDLLTMGLGVERERCTGDGSRLTRSEAPPTDPVSSTTEPPPVPSAPSAPPAPLGTPGELIRVDFTPVRGIEIAADERGRPVEREEGTPHEVIEIDFTPIGDPMQLAQVAERAKARETQRVRAGRRRPRRGRFP